MFQGTFIFPDPPYYGWYLSAGAIFLNASWSMHNVIAWIKNKPFLSRRTSLVYIGTVIVVQPYWILEIVANFLYFNDINPLFQSTRPYEALFRDPWWIFTVCNLFWNIKRRYEFSLLELCRVSPRFAILLLAMCLSICFIIVDILSVTHVVTGSGTPDGINPWWKLAFVFKCLTDTVILDDFKTALDRLKKHRMKRLGSFDADADNVAAYNTDDGTIAAREMEYAHAHAHHYQRKSPQRSDHDLARVSPRLGGRRESGGLGAPQYQQQGSPGQQYAKRGSTTKTRDWADLEIEFVDLEMQEPARVRTRSLA